MADHSRMGLRAVRPDVRERFRAIESRAMERVAEEDARLFRGRRPPAPARVSDPTIRAPAPTPDVPRCGSCGGPIIVADDELVTRQAAGLLGMSESRFSILRTAAQLTPVRIIGQTNVYRRADVEALARRRHPHESVERDGAAGGGVDAV